MACGCKFFDRQAIRLLREILDDWKKGQLRYADLGVLTRVDFLNAAGELKRSDRGEMSLEVSELRILAKVLRPLPLKLEDVETRRRYLDLAINPPVRRRFERRSLFWRSVRDFLNERGFLEVNIPVLEQTTGGSEQCKGFSELNDPQSSWDVSRNSRRDAAAPATIRARSRLVGHRPADYRAEDPAKAYRDLVAELEAA